MGLAVSLREITKIGWLYSFFGRRAKKCQQIRFGMPTKKTASAGGWTRLFGSNPRGFETAAKTGAFSEVFGVPEAEAKHSVRTPHYAT
ncbi:MAG: hypothetical protein Rhob2KO_21240 [Rhodopirellula baltica]